MESYWSTRNTTIRAVGGTIGANDRESDEENPRSNHEQHDEQDH